MVADCASWHRKYELDAAWRSAAGIYEVCLQRVATATNATTEATAALVSLGDCSEYKMRSPERDLYAKQWNYLEHLENSQACTGWCTPGERGLWSTAHRAMDLCSRAAGQKLDGEIKKLALRMIALGIVAFIVSIYALGVMQNVLSRMGRKF
jgi:hypothetical protein